MGLDLTLMPIEVDGFHFGYSHQLIDVERNSRLFELILAIPSMPVPTDFSTFRSRLESGEYGYGKTQETPYGEPLMAIKMADLKKVKIPGPAGAFVSASQDDQRVALFWH